MIRRRRETQGADGTRRGRVEMSVETSTQPEFEYMIERLNISGFDGAWGHDEYATDDFYWGTTYYIASYDVQAFTDTYAKAKAAWPGVKQAI